ncbi:hypothetical protein GCL60_02535 [Silvanigrella paludirubra]|uniref:Uncharacterized protein n=1 Tax=Silvanigrella paludirubra TaxID=2499159 RepID=A0A6N6VWG9_9BACT|nr:hypothetical protein [Silvanigrella paludirubra]KAB8040823.1 hypothetical protein GCL60_02535 [Silvanigrella paludirubra]
MKVLKIFLFSSLFLNSISWANIPTWAQKTGENKKKDHIVIPCQGIGPSLDLARTEAKNSCIHSIQNRLNVEYTDKSYIIEDEKQIVFHREIASQTKYENLVCNQLNEEIESFHDHYSVWIQCEYDLSKIKVKKLNENNNNLNTKNIKKDNSWIQNRGELATPLLSNNNIIHNKSVYSSSKIINISVIPQCSQLLIRGKKSSRIVDCNTNPISVLISPEETQIIVRSVSGYLPKTIQLSETRNKDENVQVILDRG